MGLQMQPHQLRIPLPPPKDMTIIHHKSTGFSCREPGLYSQHLHNGLEPCITPIPVDPTLFGFSTHVVYITYKQNIHKIKINWGWRETSISVAKAREKSSFVCIKLNTPLLPSSYENNSEKHYTDSNFYLTISYYS